MSRNRRSKDPNTPNFRVKKKENTNGCISYLKRNSSHTIFYIQLKNSGQIILTLLNFENRCCTNQPRENLMKEIKTLENTKINPVAYLCLKRLLLKMRQKSHFSQIGKCIKRSHVNAILRKAQLNKNSTRQELLSSSSLYHH